jgi:hypothetical protein
MVLTKDGICTIVDVVIVNPMRMDLLPQSCETQKFVALNVVQAKKKVIVTNTPLINAYL